MTRGRGGVVMVAGMDSKACRDVTGDLRRAGFTTVECPDTKGALAYLALGERLDALVMGDRSMERGPDLDLAGLARSARPRLSIVYVSPRCPGEARMPPDSAHVSMPFRSGQVAAAVSERLASRVPRAA